MSPFTLLLIVIILICLFGGGGLHFGNWAGPSYANWGYGGLGLGTIVFFLLVILLLTGRL